MTSEGRGDAFEAFLAGWRAAYRRESHEWGPGPPNNPREAFTEWQLTCRAGHIIRVKSCPNCRTLAAQGVKGIQNGRFDEI